MRDLSTDAAALAAAMDAEGQRLMAELPERVPPGSPPCVLVTVFAAQGSTPRRAGARMLCRNGQLLAGTIGGGHLEMQALCDADGISLPGQDAPADVARLATELRREVDERGMPRQLVRYPLGAKLAQCCGGVVWLHFQLVDHAVGQLLAAQLRLALLTRGEVQTWFDQGCLRELPRPLPSVIVFGAGHVAAALAQVLSPLPWRVLVVDERPPWATPGRFSSTTEVICEQPLSLLAAWGWLGHAASKSKVAQRTHGEGLAVAPDPATTYALVMTHLHALDRDIVEALLLAHLRPGPSHDRLAMVGMIGSRTKVAATHQRLARRGVPAGELERLIAPIGLTVGGRPLGGHAPGEIAISVAAQLLAMRKTA